jgi:hypothetical protein
MSSGRRNTESKQRFSAKNLEWDRVLRTPRGRLVHHAGSTQRRSQSNGQHGSGIEDLMEHLFTYHQGTANAQDVPFLLSTRLETANEETAQGQGGTDATTGSTTGDNQKQAFVLASDRTSLSTYESQHSASGGIR